MNLREKVYEIQRHIERYAAIAGRRPEEIGFLVVTKGQTVETLKELYSFGVRDFGENRVAEALDKMVLLPDDVRWHFIGKLQKNKVGKVVGRFALIHSVDTAELVDKISQASLQQGLKTEILLEANTSVEGSKGGLPPELWRKEFQRLNNLDGVMIAGLMTMAPMTEDDGVIHHCFAELRELQRQLNSLGGHLTILSMGMSRDFPLAIQEGATLLRIGTFFFS